VRTQISRALAGAQQQQVRYVDAGRQQQQRHAAGEHGQHRPRRAEQQVGEPRHAGARRVVVGRMLLRETGQHRRELALRTLGRGASSEPAQHLEVTAGAAGEACLRVVAQRHVELGVPEATLRDEIVAQRGQHAHHGIGRAADGDGPSHEVGVGAVAPPPESIGQDCHVAD